MRFLRWFSEPVMMPRGWLYLALGWGALSLIEFCGWVLS